MGLFGFFKKPVRCGAPEWHGQSFDIDDEQIPAPIREAVLRRYRPGCTLYFANTKEGGEWWLMDGEDFIDAFWLK